MVLVRKRDRFVHALSRSLKNRDIAVAGADRLSLPGHIAVKDLIALGRFLSSRRTICRWRRVLKSPIFGLTEDTLFELAQAAAERHVARRSLRAERAGDPALAEIVDAAGRWATRRPSSRCSNSMPACSAATASRKRLVARLGQEAGDILDEFLNFCLAEEKTGMPGLEAFLATLESAAPEIKREMDQRRDEVRIMTVHAAKGLEAPVVFLVDSGARRSSTSICRG